MKKFFIIQSLVFVLFFLLLAYLRVFFQCHSEYRMAVKFDRPDDVRQAIQHYSRVLHLYHPFCSIRAKTIGRLREISMVSEKKADFFYAIRSLRVIRGSIYGNRWLVTPNRELLPWLDKQIRRLTLLLENDRVRHEKRYSSEKEIASHLKDIEDRFDAVHQMDFEPNRFWSFLVGLSFIGWITTVFVFIQVSFEGEKFIVNKALVPAGVWLLLFSLWIISLRLA